MRFGRAVCAAAALGAAMLAMSSATAAIVWANSAGDDLSEFDRSTGAQLHQFFTGDGNGRGVVQVGNVLYTTVANSNNVYKKDATTGAALGVAFSIAGSSGLQAIAYDGTNFWVGDYSGTNNAYLYSPAGTLLKTVTLSESQGYYDGLEFFNGKLIANTFDGGYSGSNGYSVYDTDGNLLTKDFIVTGNAAAGHQNGTGIAFDGTNFWISDIFGNDLTEWNGTTGAYIGFVSLQGSHGGIEDLSVDYASRGDTCGGPGQPACNTGVPEPSTLALFGGTIGLVAIIRRRRKMKV